MQVLSFQNNEFRDSRMPLGEVSLDLGEGGTQTIDGVSHLIADACCADWSRVHVHPLRCRAAKRKAGKKVVPSSQAALQTQRLNHLTRIEQLEPL